MSLSDTIGDLRPATPAISIVDERDNKKNHITLGTGINNHPSGFVVTARHVVEAHVAELLDIPVEDVVDMLQQGTPVGTQKRQSNISLRAVFYMPTPGKMLRVLAPITGFLLSPKDDICGLVLAQNQIHKESGKRVVFHAAKLGDSLDLRQGDEIATLGYPYGEDLSARKTGARLSATAGIVGAIVPFEGAEPGVYDMIQTDMLVNPGNSGGPLLLRDSGHVVGIVCSRFQFVPNADGNPLKDHGIPTGISYAVPVHRWADLLQLATQKLDAIDDGVLWSDLGLTAIGRNEETDEAGAS